MEAKISFLSFIFPHLITAILSYKKVLTASISKSLHIFKMTTNGMFFCLCSYSSFYSRVGCNEQADAVGAAVLPFQGRLLRQFQCHWQTAAVRRAGS